MRGLISGSIGLAALVAASFVVDPPGRRDAPREEEEPPARIDGSDASIDAVEDHIARLRAENERQDAEIERLDAEIRTLEGLLSEERRVRAWYRERAARVRLAANGRGPIREAVLDAAAAAHVPEEALRAAFDAALDPTDRNLVRLRDAGVAGFRGLVAILREGGEIVELGAVFAASWSPEMSGEEKALVDAAEWDSDAALVALGYCDTPRARDYLIARLRRGDAVASCAEALGRLREQRAVPLLAHAITGADAQTRADAITALGNIGGREAVSILTEYVREADADLLVEAVVALARVDRAAARREAASLLSGPRRDQLDEETREALQQYAEKK